MRQGQQNKRMRGRNRKGPNPLTRSYESNGPDVKIRGTALHIAEKYVQLARDAQASGDRVGAESYLQHAEHYYRIVAAAQAQMPQPQQVFRADEEGDEEEDRFGGYSNNNGYGERPRQGQNPYGGSQGGYGNDQQPYYNGNGNGNGQAAESDGEPAADAPEESRFEAAENPFVESRGENRGEARNEGEGRTPRGFRGRRRRPYRDNFGGEQGGEPQAGSASAAEGDG